MQLLANVGQETSVIVDWTQLISQLLLVLIVVGVGSAIVLFLYFLNRKPVQENAKSPEIPWAEFYRNKFLKGSDKGIDRK
jgi:hypothetical protein